MNTTKRISKLSEAIAKAHGCVLSVAGSGAIVIQVLPSHEDIRAECVRGLRMDLKANKIDSTDWIS